MRLVTIVGARPQFVKAAAVSATLRRRHEEILVHTGQHYDHEMSAVFFEELGIPEPDFNLEVGSGRHGAQTARILERIEDVLCTLKPDWAIVYGDTNSTLGGAIAAAKMHIPVAHVEAGLRSFNRAMPEELNRILADHACDLLLCPSETAVMNLAREGITEGVRMIGDVMYDALQTALPRARAVSGILKELQLEEGAFSVATLHRAENTDNHARLAGILSGLGSIEECVLLVAHPRTTLAMQAAGVSLPPNVRLHGPLGYLDMCRLTEAARLVFTDSGGLQKEAYWLGTPCVTLREETEWVETVTSGWNTLVGSDPARIAAAARRPRPLAPRPTLYGGDGGATERCLVALETAHRGRST